MADLGQGSPVPRCCLRRILGAPRPARLWDGLALPCRLRMAAGTALAPAGRVTLQTVSMRLGVLATHPIQYHAPLYRALAARLDLEVFFAYEQTAQGQAQAGFGVAFEWDVPLLDGYRYRFLKNVAAEPNTGTFRGCSTPEIADIIARGRFDAFLVNGWYNRSYWQAIRACWRTGTPVMVRGDSHLGTPRSWPKQAAKTIVYRAFIPRFDAYLVVGQRAREYYLAYGAKEERMHFVPHFVDNARFREAAEVLRQDREGLRAGHGFGAGETVYLFAGKFIQEKRPLDFVEAIAKAAQVEPGTVGAMVGDGPLRPQIEEAIMRTGAPVRLLGFFNQSRMPEAYVLADALVLSSASETWGLVVNEAMACGLPAVVSDAVGCAPDLIEPGLTGYTYPEGEVQALAERLLRLRPVLGSDAVAGALRDRMAVYSLDTAVEGVLEALDAVASPRVLQPHVQPSLQP